MNGKKIACVLLLMLIGIASYCGQIVHQKTEAKRAEAESAIDEATAQRGKLETAKIMTEKLRFESDELIRFVRSWAPYADRLQTQSEVEESVLASLRAANMLILSQRFEVRQMQAKNSGSTAVGVIPKIVRAALVLEDDYAKTLNWIGELERRLPMARMMNCRLTGGDNGRQVHAEISLEVPLVNLKFETSPATKDTKKKA